MTTVPPPSPSPPLLPTAPSAAPALLIVQPPAAVAALSPGTTLEGNVVGGQQSSIASTAETVAPAGKTSVTVRTPAGEITIRLPVQLPDNARVALEILRNAAAQSAPGAQQTAQQVSVRLVSIDGQPAAQVLAELARQTADARVTILQPLPVVQDPKIDQQNPLSRAAILPQGSAWTPAGPTPLTALGTLSAFVTQGAAAPQETDGPEGLPAGPLRNQATPPPATGTPPPLAMATGAELSVRITNIQLSSAAVPSSVPQSLGAAPQAATPLAAAVQGTIPPTSTTMGSEAVAVAPTPVPVTVGTAAQPALPQPGLTLPGPLGLPAPPPQPPLTVTMPPPLAVLSGSVIGAAPGGAPIVENDAGLLQLNVRANLPTGTRLTIEITAQLDPRPGTPVQAPLPASSLPLLGPPGAAAGWPTLTEALAVLQRADPQAAQQLAQTIPDGGPRTAAALTSFALAMRSGDSRQWPGDVNLRALERSGPRGAHLASQLSDEVTVLASRAREAGTEWRALPVPWHVDGHIDRIALITRRESESDETEKSAGGGGTRFLIELDLSRLGSLQLDGMFRRESRAFDMMIRTKSALPDHIRHDLTGIFAASNAAMGLKGRLTFQVVKKFADPLGRSRAANADKSGLWA